jgi:hypothetical protein
MAISFWVSCLFLGAVRADEAMTPVTFDVGVGYVIPQEHAAEHKADFLAGLTEYQQDIDFWTPSPEDVVMAERVFREWLQGGAKDPAAVFPDMGTNPSGYPPGEPEFERQEMALIVQNYGSYARQYVGLVVQGRKVILCNYFAGLEADPAGGFVFLQKAFAKDKGIHFVQAWYDPDARTCSELVMVGLWQKEQPDF